MSAFERFKALGRFLLLGEYGDVSEDLAQEAQQLSLRIHTDASEPLEMRRRALETLADSSHSRVQELIKRALLGRQSGPEDQRDLCYGTHLQ